MAVRAVGAAAICGVGAGAATALVGVVETAAVELNAAGRERFCRRSAAVGAHDLGRLGHGVLNLKHIAAARALVIVARHNTSFSAQSGQIALPAKIQTAVTVPYIGGLSRFAPESMGVAQELRSFLFGRHNVGLLRLPCPVARGDTRHVHARVVV